jgi:uncharacterized membrane protein YkvA (DUF1232 family)
MAIAAQLRRWAKALKGDAVTLWFAARHPDTPWYTKALAVLVVAYALSPIDLIPDFIPVLGYLDDVILLPALIWLALRWLPEPVRVDCRARAAAWMAARGARPTSRMGIVLVVVLWLVAGVGLWWVIRPWFG